MQSNEIASKSIALRHVCVHLVPISVQVVVNVQQHGCPGLFRWSIKSGHSTYVCRMHDPARRKADRHGGECAFRQLTANVVSLRPREGSRRKWEHITGPVLQWRTVGPYWSILFPLPYFHITLIFFFFILVSCRMFVHLVRSYALFSFKDGSITGILLTRKV